MIAIMRDRKLIQSIGHRIIQAVEFKGKIFFIILKRPFRKNNYNPEIKGIKYENYAIAIVYTNY